MPTYRTETVTAPAAGPRHRLVCELCAKNVADVYSAASWAYLSASRTSAMWPESRELIRRHDAECPGTKK
jgi:hypothetical protein